jgi:hypothetical protein
MSLTLIVIIAAVAACIIGIKVYLEYKEEKTFQKAKEIDAFEDLHALVVNPVEGEIVLAEKKEDIKVVENPIDFKTADPNPAVETPKKKAKKRYYGKPGKKQNKKPFPKNKKSQ